jgi:uncharacterized membrane protein HdeD (DUF308 family)
MMLGAILIVLGFVAIAFPFFAAIGTRIAFGWILLITAVVRLHGALFSRQGSLPLYIDLAIALMCIIGGVRLAFFPSEGLGQLTLVLGAILMAQGALDFVAALVARFRRGRSAMLIAGMVAVGAGAMMIAGVPSSELWAISLLFGLNLIASGCAYFFVALAAHTNV